MSIGIISVSQRGVEWKIEWKIYNFFNLSKKEDACYYSPDFNFRGKTWYLRTWQNGSSLRESSGYVDLYLCKRSSNRSITQAFSLSLKTAKGEKYNEEHVTKVFGRYGEYEINRFIEREELSRRQSELVPDGVLTVVATMMNTTSAGSVSKSF